MTCFSARQVFGRFSAAAGALALSNEPVQLAPTVARHIGEAAFGVAKWSRAAQAASDNRAQIGERNSPPSSSEDRHRLPLLQPVRLQFAPRSRLTSAAVFGPAEPSPPVPSSAIRSGLVLPHGR